LGEISFSKNTMRFKYRVDWQTPDKYIEAAQRVFNIDLDPMSSENANRRIQADKFYSEGDSCFDHDWHGNVWLNPAYSYLPQAVEKLIYHYNRGDVKEAILFTHTAETWVDWFQTAIEKASAVCFVSELVEWHPGHQHEMPKIMLFKEPPKYDTRGTVACYYGPYKGVFIQNFNQFGVIL
jgi:hypothetical protein